MDTFFKIILAGLVSLTGGVSFAGDSHRTTRQSTYGAPTHVMVPSGDAGEEATRALVGQSTRVLQEDSMIVTFSIVKHPYYGSRRQAELGRRECQIIIGEAGAPNRIPVQCDRIQQLGRSISIDYTYKGYTHTYILDQARGDFVQNGGCLDRYWYPERRLETTVVWSTHDNIQKKKFVHWLEKGLRACN